MSFYRAVLATLLGLALTIPCFAEESLSGPEPLTADAVPMQLADNANIDANATTEPLQPTKVNINTATIKQLMKVKGISPTKARAIVSYRKKNGNYKTLDDLKLVKGFKKMKEDKLKTIQAQLVAE